MVACIMLMSAQSFGGAPQLELLRELFTQVFSTPYHHPKSKAFVDHTLHFSVLDNRIWFRNYQVESSYPMIISRYTCVAGILFPAKYRVTVNTLCCYAFSTCKLHVSVYQYGFQNGILLWHHTNTDESNER